MNRRRIHVLYEYGPDLRPYGSAYVRLLRPLTHPALRETLQVTAGLDYDGHDVDAVIVDRLWRPDISPSLAENLVEKVRRAGARLIYALDDNFLMLPEEQKDWRISEEQIWTAKFFLREADGILVTTQVLKEQLADLNSNIVVVPNALDERLLVRNAAPLPASPFGPRRKVIGYMGTLTHDDDLMMIVPALRTVCQHHQREIEIQIVGVIGHAATTEALTDLPVRLMSPRPEEVEYPLFMLWFSSRLMWDIGISPLKDTPFGRCKSDIKFLDYSTIAAAGIYSRAPAYESSVRHRDTGWLAENETGAWVEALEELLSNGHLRTQLAQNAARYLYGERVLRRRVHYWLTALDSLLGSL